MARGRFTDLTGKEFGNLIVIKKLCYRSGYTWWMARCNCGHLLKAVTHNILEGSISHCGCLDAMDRKNTATYSTTTEALKDIHTEMMSQTRHRVGARWKDFSKFKQDMITDFLEHVRNFGVSSTVIKLRDKNGDYLKSNTYWGTP